MTNAELAILGLVAERPLHGYEIEQVIDQRGMRDWTEIGFSSIYYLLNKLEKAGFVERALRAAERGAVRKVYTLTEAGREALKNGVVAALSTPQRCYLPIQIGLANLPSLSTEEAITALTHYRDVLVQRAAGLRAKWESQMPVPDFVAAMFEHSLALINAELQWARRFLEHLETRRHQGWSFETEFIGTDRKESSDGES